MKLVLYMLFGVSVLGGYAVTAATGVDVSSTATHRSRLPAGTPAGGYAAVPIVWRTGFHGPRVRSTSYGSGGSYGSGRRSGGGGVYYGGYGGGK